jgi:hypothetical protein
MQWLASGDSSYFEALLFAWSRVPGERLSKLEALRKQPPDREQDRNASIRARRLADMIERLASRSFGDTLGPHVALFELAKGFSTLE